MSKKLRIALAQLNFLVGDLSGNLNKHIATAQKARDELQADVIVFPELSLTSYPPEDLLLRPDFIQDAMLALKKMIKEVHGIYCLVGHPHLYKQHLFNACTLFYNGSVKATYHKQCLPNYGVFDEARYFFPGNLSCIVPINDIPVALLICEDLWRVAPAHDAKQKGAQIILTPNASPFEVDKHQQRVSVLSKRSNHNQIPIIYVNHVGGQDELVFDGGSMVVNSQGEVCELAGFFKESLFAVDVDLNESNNLQQKSYILPSTEEQIYQALVLSIRDYVRKNNFKSVIVGLSGGIDSALTLVIAVDALGKENVHAVMMPSQFTASMSIEDANIIVQNVGIPLENISIEPIFYSFNESLANSFKQTKPDVTEENIQARCRAVILMALSNKFGHLVLTTGNRSELAVGYCTLYGDMAGSFAVLKDVPKTLVYQLARYRNQQQTVIPERVITRPPTAELAHDQKDEDSLPPYDLLDQILECYLNQSQSIAEIVAQGFDEAIVTKVVHLIHKNEYKRRQAAPGPHINHKSFGKDWRYPITDGFKK